MAIVTVGRIDRVNLCENTIRVRIDRGTPLGNPIRISNHLLDEDITREDAIESYRVFFNRNIRLNDTPLAKKVRNLLKILTDGVNIELTCWCSPKACHGDVIKEYLEDRLNN